MSFILLGVIVLSSLKMFFVRFFVFFISWDMMYLKSSVVRDFIFLKFRGIKGKWVFFRKNVL